MNLQIIGYSTHLCITPKDAGYYDQYKASQNLSNYGITYQSSEESDLIRRRWLDNDFYGFVFINL